jgi:hypothetical protein
LKYVLIPERIKETMSNKFDLALQSLTATFQAKLILPPQCSFVHNSIFMLAAEWGLL